MLKTRSYAKCSLGHTAFRCVDSLPLIFWGLIIFFFASCQSLVHEDKGEQLVESIISDSQVIKTSYSNCLANMEANKITIHSCKDEVAIIRSFHKKTKMNLLTLAELRDKGGISDKTYRSYIERLDKELEGVRNLSRQLREKGLSFDLEWL